MEDLNNKTMTNTEKLKNFEQLLSAHHMEIKQVKTRLNGFEDVLKDTKNSIEKIKTMVGDLKELKSSGSGSSSEGGGVSKDELELAVKEFILKSDDILELIEKVGTNVSEHHLRKDEVEKYVDKRFKVLTKSKNIFYVFLGICLVFGVGAWFFLKSNTRNIKIPANTAFYSYKNNKSYQSEVPFVATGAKVIGNKAYFAIGGKKYYFILRGKR